MPLRFLLTIWFFILMPLQALAAQEIFPFLAEVKSDSVKVRAGQSVNFEEVCELDAGEEVVVTGRSFSWYKIKLPVSATSFISAQYVYPVNEQDGEVIGDRVNVRARPDANSTVLGQVRAGENVKILKKTGEWYQIRPLEESSGWIAEDLLAFKSQKIPAVKKSSEAALARNTVEEQIEAQGLSVPWNKQERAAVESQNEEGKGASASAVQTVSLTGIVKPVKNPGRTEIFYQLVIDGKPAYDLRGFKHVLDTFSNFTVEVEGSVQPQFEEDSPHPVLNVSRIQLVL